MLAKGLLCVLLAGIALAQDYSAEDQNAREQHLSPHYARQGGYHHDPYENARAEPYDFGFQSTDEFGTIMNRQESSDNNGAVRGSYGYTDPYGVFRHVDYVADEHGFRAEIKSNEPGMGTQSPANVQIYAEPPPAGVIVERPYYNPHHHQQGQGGQQTAQPQPPRRNPTQTSAANQGRQTRPGAGAGGARAPATSNTRATVVRPGAYPYTPSQQGSFQGSSQYPASGSNQYASSANNQNQAASSGQFPASSSGQYPASSSGQYPASGSGQYASSGNGQYPASGSGQYASSGNGQYSASGNSQYSASSSGQYPDTVSNQYAANTQYNQASSSAYPARGQYFSGTPSYSSQSASQQVRSTAGSSSSSSSQAAIVAKPYDGPTYRIGNPHVTDLVRAEKEESGSILLPTVVASGGVPTLVKHIHTYPAPTA